MANSLEKLIYRCQKNDRKAQESIYTSFSPILFSICLRYAANYEDAQDTFQEGFVLIFKKIDQFQFQGSFEGWMKKIMINCSLEKFRKKNYSVIYDLETIPHLLDEELDDWQEEICYDELLEAVQTLPHQYRQVFNLFAIEEYSHQEIASLLQISVGTSKSNLSRARSILKEKLAHLITPLDHEPIRSTS